jgi:hypothetical protein
MTVYQALALSAVDRRQVLEKSAFLGGIGSAISNTIGGWGKDSTGRGYLQRKLMDPVWNAGASGVKSIANDAANAAKGMYANATTAVDNGIDKGLNFVDQNISKPMQQAGQAAWQGAQNLGNQAIQGAQNLHNQALQGVQTMGNQALDAGLNFVDQNVARPVFGTIGLAQNAFQQGMARHGNAYLPQQPAPQPGAPQ